jgi:tetratricopeptide (TPR) repeat protein
MNKPAARLPKPSENKTMQTRIRKVVTLASVVLLVLAGAGCTAKVKKSYHLSRANRFYDAGKMGSAEIEYMNVLRFDPANGHAYARLGRIYYDEGRLQRALYFLSKSAQMTPDDLDLRTKLGFIYSSSGLATQAMAQADFVLAKKPQDDDATLLVAEAGLNPKETAGARQRLQDMARKGDRAAIEVALGNLALREQNLAEAAADFKKAQALDAKAPFVNSGLAMLAWEQGDVKQADVLFKAAADASPIRSPRRMQYARFKMMTGDTAGARAVLGEIIQGAPDYVPAPLVLAEIAAAEGKPEECQQLLDKVLASDADNYDALLFQGQLDLSRNDGARAVTDMERMARLYPQLPTVQCQLGAAYLEINDTVKASASLGRALELNPNLAQATLLLSQIHISNGNASPAIIALEALRKKQPKLVQAQLLLADAYRLAGRNQDALAIYASLEKDFPKNVQVPLLRGAALFKLKDLAGARQAFERVLQISPTNLPAIEQLVNLDLSAKNFDAALTRVNSQIQQGPGRVEFRILAAKIYLAQTNYAAAENALQDAHKVDPSHLGAPLLLAQLYSDTGRNPEALKELNDVMSKDTRNTSALMLVAKIYENSRDYKDAADAYERVIQLDARSDAAKAAYNNLAYLYSEKLDRLDRAYELAQKAREFLPFDPSTADTLGWIDFKRGAYNIALGLLQGSAAKLQTDPEVQFHFGMANYMTGDEADALAALQRAMQGGTNFLGSDECRKSLAILAVSADAPDLAARAMLEKRVSDRPDDPVALTRLAKIYQGAGNADKAAGAYEALLKAMPKNLNAMTNLVQLYAATDGKKAYEMAKAANKIAPYDPGVSHSLGRLAYLSGDYSISMSLLQQAAQSQPNDGVLQLDFAQSAYAIGKISDAQAALQKAMALNLPAPQAAQARRMWEMMTFASTPAQAAAADARIAEVLKSEPDNAPALMARAAAGEFNSNFGDAEQAYEKILTRFPDFTPAQKKLARLYAGEPGKLDRAYACAMKARETLPDDPALAKTLGIILVQRGNYDQAASLLKQSSSRISPDAEWYYYLGTAQFHLKNRPDSKNNLQQALNLKLSGAPAEAAKKMLAELK